MSESPHRPEDDVDTREIRSVLACYTIGALMKSSPGYFRQDLYEGIGYIEENTHFATGLPITDKDIDALASSSVIVQISEKFNEEDSIVLSPEIPRAVSVYRHAQEVIDRVGLTAVKAELDISVALATVRSINGKMKAPSPVIAVAVETWNARGKVTMEMESTNDIIAAALSRDHSTEAPDKYYEEANLRVEEYSLSALRVPSTMEQVPYYAQFYEVEHGREWLGSLLADLEIMYEKAMRISP